MLLKTEIKPDMHYHVFCFQLNPHDQHCNWHIWLDWIWWKLIRKFSFFKFHKILCNSHSLKKNVKCVFYSMMWRSRYEWNRTLLIIDVTFFLLIFMYYSAKKKSRQGSKLMPNVKYSLETILFIIFTLLWHTRR